MANQDIGIMVVSIFNTEKCVQMSFRLFTYLHIEQQLATVGHRVIAPVWLSDYMNYWNAIELPLYWFTEHIQVFLKSS